MVSNYDIQLEQVIAAISTDPDNVELFSLKKDLEAAIQLSNELAFKKRPAPSQLSKTQVKKNPSKVELIGPEYDKPSVDKQEDLLNFLKIGDKCQTRIDGGGWVDATISSISSNRNKWVVITIKSNETKSTTSRDIRPMPEHRSAPFLQLMPLDNSQVHLQQQELTQKVKEKKIKKVAARQEYITRREAEHEEKASAWTSFRSKLSKKTSPSLFKSQMVGKKRD